MRYLTLLFLFVSVSGDYLSDYWTEISDAQKRIFENFGDFNLWGKANWFGVQNDMVQGVSLGYDEKYQNDLKVVDDNVTSEINIVRPCTFYDIQCIRKVFARNSRCTPSYGLPDPLYLARNTIQIPFSNMTITLTDVKVTGLGSATIREFYINRVTGNLVFAITVRNLNETSKKSFFNYKRTAKESIVLADNSSMEFDSLTFTAIIPKAIGGLRLDLGEFHANVHDAAPKYVFGPNVIASRDPDVLASYADLINRLPIVTREIFMLQAQLLTALYIQSNICDFGVKLYTV